MNTKKQWAAELAQPRGVKGNPKATQKQPSFTPEWLSFEVSEALGRIDGPHAAQKETTVLRLAEARALGQSWNEVFRQRKSNGVCQKKVWYGFPVENGRQAGWGEDATVMSALELATARARWWVRVKKGRAVENALDILTNGADGAAEQLVRIALQGRAAVVRGQAEEFEEASVPEIVKAANSVLDRVSEATAAKRSLDLEHRVNEATAELLDRVWGEE